MAACEIYKPINWWQIRLLKLLPEAEDDVLEGELVIADMIHGDSGVVLHDEEVHVEYDALSYAWGAPEFTCPIRLNKTIKMITPTLGQALKRLRYHRWIWCDALCTSTSRARD